MNALRNIATAALQQVKSHAKALTVILVASLAVGVITAKHFHEMPTENPVEARFAALGRANGPRLLAADAMAFEAAAKDLHAGKSVADVATAIPKAAADNLAATGRRWLAPDLETVIPAGKPEAQITPAERNNLEAAYLGYARGLRALKGKYP